ncbi:MAG: hypothetical protein AAGA77_05090 [Bacteroidota bacterium]
MIKKLSSYLERRGKSKSLFVILHGFRGTPQKMRFIKKNLADVDPDADFYIPKLPFSSIFSRTTPSKIVQKQFECIEYIWNDKIKRDHKEYDKIVLVGFSFGALIVRKLFVVASGECKRAPFEKEIKSKEVKKWSSKIERIILIAGANKGWRISYHMELPTYLLFSLAYRIARPLGRIPGLKSTMLYIKRGTPFINDLRAQWILLHRRFKKDNIEPPITIQLLGSKDEIVPPEDDVDLSSGSKFIYLDVPNSNHGDMVKMDNSKDGKERSRIFLDALTKDREALKQLQVSPYDPDDLIKSREDITDVIFVIHGIRDVGYWTHKVARRIKSKAEKQYSDRKFATETSSYGFFPIIDFLLLGQREKKVQWLMEEYLKALAYYPKAQFSFVGHSNGTYLLAEALNTYESCRFKNVVFASSVVNTKYDWASKLKEGKVENVLNYTATTDVVVAWFPYFFEKIGSSRLGGAGHVGFKSKAIDQIGYIKGYHSASREEENWDSIAEFIINGPKKKENWGIIAEEQSWVFKGFNIFAHRGLIVLLLLSIIVGLGFGLWYLCYKSIYGWTVVFVILYTWVIIRILKKF